MAANAFADTGSSDSQKSIGEKLELALKGAHSRAVKIAERRVVERARKCP